MAVLTHAEKFGLLEICRNDVGPHILDIRRPASAFREWSSPKSKIAILKRKRTSKDFAHLNDLHRNALTVWVEELLTAQENVLFDTRQANNQDSVSEQSSEFWNVLTHVDSCGYLAIFHHENGPHILDIRRPDCGLRKGSMPQIDLAMLYGKIKTIRYFPDGEVYSLSLEIRDPNPRSTCITTCRAELDWPTLDGCRNAIERILGLNPEHTVDVHDGMMASQIFE